MKIINHILFILSVLVCISCGNAPTPKPIKAKPKQAQAPKCFVFYSKDSTFMSVKRVDEVGHKNPNVKPDTIYTVYMKYKGSYREVHDLAGYDIVFVYSDSTKSRYDYDKRGKHFLKGKERALFFQAFFAM